MNTIQKPWGYEEIVEINEFYVVKRLFMRAGHQCSLQYHQHKHETLIIESGLLSVISGSHRDNLIEVVMGPGAHLSLPQGIIHRMKGIEDSYYLECSTPQLDDVIRLKDDYNRETI